MALCAPRANSAVAGMKEEHCISALSAIFSVLIILSTYSEASRLKNPLNTTLEYFHMPHSAHILEALSVSPAVFQI